MGSCRNIFVALLAIVIGLRFSPFYPRPVENFIASSLDSLEAIELPNSINDFLTTFPSKVGINNHASHFTMNLKDNDFFEGWYYKIVSKDLKTTVITIPAMFFDKENDDHHGFIMHGIVHHEDDGTVRREIIITNFTKDEISIKNFPGDKFEFKLGNNVFRNHYFSLDIEDVVKGEINFDQVVEYPKSITIPSIMGFFTYIDAIFGMQCVHKVLVVDSKTSGNLSILHKLNKEISFDSGRGYIEGDYGSEFPERYVWLSSNHFSSNRGSSVMLSVAKVPFPNDKYKVFDFEGFIGYVYDAANDKFFKFGTYTGAIIEVEEGSVTNKLEEKSKVSFLIRDLQYLIEITAVGNREGALHLWGPKQNNDGKFMMSRYVKEMLDSQIHVSVRRRSDNSLIFEGIGLKAGLEIEI